MAGHIVSVVVVIVVVVVIIMVVVVVLDFCVPEMELSSIRP